MPGSSGVILKRARPVLRYLILSDIHSNLHALVAALTAADGRYDAIVCCGDLVGYGACPNETVTWASKYLKQCVRGNHDKVAAGLESPEGYNPVATRSLEWTAQTLNGANLAYVAALPVGPVAHDALWLMHGSPVDEDLYLVQESDARGMNPFLPGNLNFFGHTHRQGGFVYFRQTMRTLGAVRPDEPNYTLAIEPDVQYLVNPGSIGQPRDGDPRAAFCIFDAEEATICFFRTAYDIEGAATAILKAGLPELLARRLFLGK